MSFSLNTAERTQEITTHCHADFIYCRFSLFTVICCLQQKKMKYPSLLCFKGIRAGRVAGASVFGGLSAASLQMIKDALFHQTVYCLVVSVLALAVSRAAPLRLRPAFYFTTQSQERGSRAIDIYTQDDRRGPSPALKTGWSLANSRRGGWGGGVQADRAER